MGLSALGRSFHVACLLSPNFSVIAPNDAVLKGIETRIKEYGLGARYIPGIHLGGLSLESFVASFGDPRPVVDRVSQAALELVARGAQMLVPGFGVLNLFLVDQGVREVEGVPFLDNTAALIKMAETLVDLRALGVEHGRSGPFSALSREELQAARKLYGVE